MAGMKPISLLILCLIPTALAAESRIAWRVTNLDQGETVNMRASASPAAAVIVKVPHDAGILDAAGECVGGKRFVWCPVQYKGQDGWIADQYLQKVRVRTRKVTTPKSEEVAETTPDEATPAPSSGPVVEAPPAEMSPPEPEMTPQATPEAPVAVKPQAADKEGLFFVYHQLEPKKRPKGCVPIDVEKLPPVDQLQAYEGAIGKRELTTTCCKVNYLYFGRLSDCEAYLRAHDLEQGQETEPVTVPAETVD